MPEHRLRIFSHMADVHNMHRQAKYHDVLEQLEQLIEAGQLEQTAFEIPVSKHNFIDVISAVNHALDLLQLDLRLRWPFPKEPDRGSLLGRFRQQIAALNLQTAGRIQVTFDDPVVEDILERLQQKYGDQAYMILQRLGHLSRAQCTAGHHLRILGAMLDDTFIGPFCIVLDLYHRCNTDCVHCWIHSRSIGSGVSEEFLNLQLDFERIKGIVDDAVEIGVTSFTLLGDGEPMLHRHFAEIIEYIKAKDIYCQVVAFTNGLSMKKRIAEVMVDCFVDEVYVSVPAATAKTWVTINPSRQEKHFHRLRENLLRLKRLKEQMGPGQDFDHARPRTILSFVISNLNYFEIEEMMRFAVEMGAHEVRFQVVQIVRGLEFLALDHDMLAQMRDRLPVLKQIARDHDIEFIPDFEFQLEHIMEDGGPAPGGCGPALEPADPGRSGPMEAAHQGKIDLEPAPPEPLEHSTTPRASPAPERIERRVTAAERRAEDAAEEDAEDGGRDEAAAAKRRDPEGGRCDEGGPQEPGQEPADVSVDPPDRAAGHDLEPAHPPLPNADFPIVVRETDPRPQDGRPTDWTEEVYTIKGCYIGWAFALIKANGDVSFCCACKIVDNLDNRSFKDIWFSKRYQRYRSAAKDLLANRDLEFNRDRYNIDHHLYNNRCDQCSNLGANNYLIELIEQFDLFGFIPGLPKRH